jgi:UDPglucose--hexose-1-phosphate uridylyltransferase
LGAEEVVQHKVPEYDPNCYLCPGNVRATGQANPPYTGTYVFKNDYPAVNSHSSFNIDSPLYKAKSITGDALVVCFSPKHNLTMAQMTIDQIVGIIAAWKDQILLLTSPNIAYVQIFENKGAIMGCSNPHPHGQIWATEHIPDEPQKELISLQNYKLTHGSCLLCDYVAQEMEKSIRVIDQNDSFIILVPFWAVWPFETLLLPKFHCSSLSQLNEAQARDLADMLQSLTARYDNVFSSSFPYSMGIHGAPVNESPIDHIMHLHFHFYPPLLRSATVKKFLVGYCRLTLGLKCSVSPNVT